MAILKDGLIIIAAVLYDNWRRNEWPKNNLSHVPVIKNSAYETLTSDKHDVDL